MIIIQDLKIASENNDCPPLMLLNTHNIHADITKV